MLISPQRAYERYQPRHCADAGASYESLSGTTAMLFSHQALCHFGSLLRRQQQRGPQKVHEHGCESVRLPLVT